MTRFYQIFFYLSLVLFSTQLQALQALDHIVAIVNDQVITYKELQSRIKDFERQMTQAGTAVPDNKIMQKQVLERIIVDTVQLQLAQAQGIQIDDLTLNRMLENLARQNKITLEGLRKALQREGIDYKNFREQTRKDLIIKQVRQRMVIDRLKISEQEIDQFLEQQEQSGKASSGQYHLAHILITTPEAATPKDIAEAYDKAEKVLAHLKDGESFRDVALNFSEGRQALEGGDLGWRSAAELPSLFLDAVKRLDKGEVSSPLRSAGGFHIIKLIDKKTMQHIVTQTHARHILIRADEITTEEQVREKMNAIKQRLDNGEDFAKLAEAFSQDPGSKNNGGDLGWASEGDFVPRFENVMNSLKPMQISEPFRSQFGWHIMQILERREQDETEQLKRERAEIAIKKRKSDEELQLWLRRIRDEAFVEYRNNPSS
ncbi:MAG: peptidylprolyl isomerase [Gammaproteobacteria bacterium]|nr:peptidylprolyl isomerase [Gammaproteobacteria bacterium]